MVDKAPWVILSVLGLLALKGLTTFALALAFGLPRHDAVRTALYLAEAGEFAFVVIGQATLSYGLMDQEVGQFMVIVAGVSMALTPLLAFTAGWAGRRLEPRDGRIEAHAGETSDLSGHVLIAGYGRVGQTVAALLRSQTIPYIALDLDAARVRRHRDAAEPVYFGDAARAEVLKRAGADRAAVLLVTLDDPWAAGRTVEAVRRLWPKLHILVRARDTIHSDELLALGADAVVPETLEASLQLAGYVLRTLGTPSEAVNACIESIRGHGYDEVRDTVENAQREAAPARPEPSPAAKPVSRAIEP
jgi:CPA2 family monovalent cation:H+ antiporter-2